MSIFEKVQEIFRLATLVQEENGLITVQTNDKLNTPTRPTVFVYFSGHVSGLSVRVYLEGWKKDCDCDEGFDFYLDTCFDRRLKEIDRCIAYLQSLVDQYNPQESEVV